MLNLKRRRFLAKIKRLKRKIKSKKESIYILSNGFAQDLPRTEIIVDKLGLEVHKMEMDLLFLSTQLGCRKRTQDWN